MYEKIFSYLLLYCNNFDFANYCSNIYKKHKKENVISLFEKTKSYTNIVIYGNINNSEIFYSQGVLVSKSGNYIMHSDLNTGTVHNIDTQRKSCYITKENLSDLSTISPYLKSLSELDTLYKIKLTDLSFSKEMYNDVNCITYTYNSTTVFVHPENGLVLKICFSDDDTIFTYDYKLNSLTASDMAVPDLSEYQVESL